MFVSSQPTPEIPNSPKNSKMISRIEGFKNEYEFMSNFVPSRVILDGVIYPTVEHAYQAAKSLDPVQRDMIKKAKTPGQSKRLGQLLVIRTDWEEVKESVMRELLFQKFSQPEFMELLLATGDAYLEETNWWKDRYWGVCEGKGKNRLGFILMEIREALKEIQAQMLVSNK